MMQLQYHHSVNLNQIMNDTFTFSQCFDAFINKLKIGGVIERIFGLFIRFRIEVFETVNQLNQNVQLMIRHGVDFSDSLLTKRRHDNTSLKYVPAGRRLALV